jgi:hypothetical protein
MDCLMLVQDKSLFCLGHNPFREFRPSFDGRQSVRNIIVFVAITSCSAKCAQFFECVVSSAEV